MRVFDYQNNIQMIYDNEIVSLMTQIYEMKGMQTELKGVKSDVLNQLLEIAKIQSTDASNKIEGIYTSDIRLKKLVLDKTMPQNRSEQEIAGYRDVLNTIHANYQYIDIKPNVIKQLHRDLYRFSGNIGGSYKNSNNVIAEEDSEGNKRARFIPVEAWETPGYMDAICSAYTDAINAPNAEPLVVVPAFILDFLCVHPFNDGNGRMSRLLTLLLLYKCGFEVGKYISIEKEIERTKETYYEALQASSLSWHEGKNNYAPFVRYFLGVLLATYREFQSRLDAVKNDLSKPARIRKIIKNTIGKITKTQIMEQCPDISQVTVQRTLIDLCNSGEIIKIGGGRYTTYIWNHNKE